MGPGQPHGTSHVKSRTNERRKDGVLDGFSSLGVVLSPRAHTHVEKEERYGNLGEGGGENTRIAVGRRRKKFITAIEFISGGIFAFSVFLG